MKIYLAARYSRHAEMQQYATDLEALGHTVTSRWIHGSHQVPDDGLRAEASPELRQRFAQEDWSDLEAADVVISFTEPPRASNSRGGRHVEFGAALAFGKVCVVIGPFENIFHCLEQVEVFGTWQEFLSGIPGPRPESEEGSWSPTPP